MAITTMKVYKEKNYPRFYYYVGYIDDIREVFWVKLAVPGQNTFTLFGIDGEIPHSQKFNNKVKKIVRALLDHPMAFEQLTLISPKDINEGCDAIVDYIMKH